MKHDYATQRANKVLGRTAKMLLIAAVVFFATLLVAVLESEALIRGAPASDWYISALNFISVATV